MPLKNSMNLKTNFPVHKTMPELAKETTASFDKLQEAFKSSRIEVDLSKRDPKPSDQNTMDMPDGWGVSLLDNPTGKGVVFTAPTGRTYTVFPVAGYTEENQGYEFGGDSSISGYLKDLSKVIIEREIIFCTREFVNPECDVFLVQKLEEISHIISKTERPRFVSGLRPMLESGIITTGEFCYVDIETDEVLKKNSDLEPLIAELLAEATKDSTDGANALIGFSVMMDYVHHRTNLLKWSTIHIAFTLPEAKEYRISKYGAIDECRIVPFSGSLQFPGYIENALNPERYNL